MSMQQYFAPFVGYKRQQRVVQGRQFVASAKGSRQNNLVAVKAGRAAVIFNAIGNKASRNAQVYNMIGNDLANHVQGNIAAAVATRREQQMLERNRRARLANAARKMNMLRKVRTREAQKKRLARALERREARLKVMAGLRSARGNIRKSRAWEHRTRV